MKNRYLFPVIILSILFQHSLFSQEKSDTTISGRPFIRGGTYDKPFIRRLFGQTSIGGYMEAVWKFERTEGVTEEITFEARRFNLFLYSAISDRLRVFAELEFEHGTEEIALEVATLDFEIQPSLIFRGGIILSPLGKFNLTHDSPLNELTDRPLVSTQLIPTALSEVGMGFYGALYPSGTSRLTYEIYGVNGFRDGILTGEGTRIREGRGDVGEDNNQMPSFVGRLGYASNEDLEVGASIHHGPYNTYSIDEFTIDERRNLTIAAIDGEYSVANVDLLGEYAFSSISIPPSLSGLYAERQRGVYLQANYRFGEGWITMLPRSRFAAVIRFDAIDFDTGIDGDAHNRLSLGLNFRPTNDTVFKLDFHRDALFNRVNVLERSAGINFSIASYF